MYKYLAEQHFWSHKISNMVHLPVMNGWVNACDTVILLSGSNTNIFSRRSFKLANIFGSSPGEPVIIDPISFGFMLKIIRFIVCNSEIKSSVSIKGKHELSSPHKWRYHDRLEIDKQTSEMQFTYLFCDRIIFCSMKIQVVIKMLISKSSL